MASDAPLACTAKLRAEARERAGQASYPAFGVEVQLEAGALEALGEVHLRRLDSPDLLHRRAVTVISIEATPQEVPYPTLPYPRPPRRRCCKPPVHLLTARECIC